MSKKDLFFEEDPETTDTASMTWEEHADSFFGVLQTEGIVSDRKDNSMAPMGAIPEMSVKHVRTTLVEIEFGVVKEDYAVHVTPTHPQKNLTNQNLYSEALKECVINLNRVVPPDLRVEIYRPQPDWEIKATSFIIRGGATAWNLNHEEIEKEVIPLILASVTNICAKA